MEMITENKTIKWDRTRLKQIDKAKSEIMTFKRRGHLILKTDGSEMEHFDPNLGEVIVSVAKALGNHVMKILCDKGDDLIVWDMDNGKQAKQAKETFEKLMKDGYRAFSLDSRGNKNIEITEFDVEAEEILMVPPTAKG